MASRCHGDTTLSLAARSMANATPTARGRCEAMVEVCGMIARSCRPNTLWRPPGDRLVGGRDDAGQDVADAVETGSRQVEATAAVVQERRVGGPRRHAQDCVALVTGRADRVVPPALRSQPSGGQVAVPAGQLHVVEVGQVEGGRSGRADSVCFASGPANVSNPCRPRQAGVRAAAATARSSAHGECRSQPAERHVSRIAAATARPTAERRQQRRPCDPACYDAADDGGRDRRRSGDPTLFRRVLCRLSYSTVLMFRPY